MTVHWMTNLSRVLLAGVLCAGALNGHANPSSPARVGWVGEVQGRLQVREAPGADWQTAPRNRPVKEGDRFSTGKGGNARLGFGVLDAFLAEDTQLELTRLDDDVIQLRLSNGRLALSIPQRAQAVAIEIDTPEGRFVPAGTGPLRLDRLDGASSARSARSSWSFRAGNLALTVQPGQRVDVWRHQGRTEYAFTSNQDDAWDTARRAQEPATYASASPAGVANVPGAEELAAHGRWSTHPEFGDVWEPRGVAPGWEPFRQGEWLWVAPWGWTWVDNAPWGFTPYHYGRWVRWGPRWVWAPGPRQPRPVFHPGRHDHDHHGSPLPRMLPPVPGPALPRPPEQRPPKEDARPPRSDQRPPRDEPRPGRDMPTPGRSHPVMPAPNTMTVVNTSPAITPPAVPAVPAPVARPVLPAPPAVAPSPAPAPVLKQPVPPRAGPPVVVAAPRAEAPKAEPNPEAKPNPEERRRPPERRAEPANRQAER
jgi:hypothetical protein